MLLGIYDTVYLVANKASTQQEFNILENIFLRLVNTDPQMYLARVWLARALSDNDIESALNHLEVALKISPSQPEAIREILRIKQNNINYNNYSEICEIYFNHQFGGYLPRNYINFLGGTNLTHLSYRLSNKKNNNLFYLQGGLILNKEVEFEIIPVTEEDINGFDLYHSLPAGLKINISKIYMNTKEREFKINLNQLNWTSDHSFLIDNGKDDILSFLTTKNGDDVIRFRIDEFLNVSKIIIIIKITRLPIMNTDLCD
jgi:hypothetical protein